MDRPSSRDYQSVKNYLENDGGPLFEEESGFIYEKEDLITLRPGREYAWLDGILERILQAFRCGLLRVSLRDFQWRLTDTFSSSFSNPK